MKVSTSSHYTENANGDVPLTVAKCVIFLASFSSRCAHVLSL